MVTRRLGPYRLLGEVAQLDLDDGAAAAAFGDLLAESLSGLAVTPPTTVATTTIAVGRNNDSWHLTVEGPHVPADPAGSIGADDSVALHRILSGIDAVAAESAVGFGCAVLHGGLVEIDGRTIAAVGPSGMGKSTFTAVAVSLGHRFVGDEVVAVDPQSAVVLPHRRPIGLRTGAAALLEVTIPPGPFRSVYPYRVDRNSSAGRAGADAGTNDDSGSRPLDSIVLLRRYAGHDGGAEVAPVPPAQALLRFSNQILGPTGTEPQMFGRIEQLVRNVPVFEVTYREAADAIAAIGAMRA
ncbi:MAG: hypothetical protein AAFY28_03055 [Actinomycetota bacterium]